LRHGGEAQEVGAEFGDFAGGAGFFVGNRVRACEIRKQCGCGVRGEIVHVDAADVVVAGEVGAAWKGFLNAAARSVDGGGAEDEGRPRSGGDALFRFETRTSALGIGIDGSGGVDVGGGSVYCGGGKVNDSGGGGAEGVEQERGFGGRDGMEHENSGTKVRREVVEPDYVRAQLRE